MGVVDNRLHKSPLNFIQGGNKYTKKILHGKKKDKIIVWVEDRSE